MTHSRPSLERVASRCCAASRSWRRQVITWLQRQEGLGMRDDGEREVLAGLTFLPSGKRMAPLVFDVGANSGSFVAALLKACPGATAIAFEPESEAYAQLRLRFANDGRVSVHNTAIGRASGRTVLYADAPGSGLTSMTRRRLSHFGLDHAEIGIARVMRLDSFIADLGATPSWVKIDVEGHEFDALVGLGDLLGEISLIQFEFGGTCIDTRVFFQDFFYLFLEKDFDLYRLGPRRPLRVLDYHEGLEVFLKQDWFAVNRRLGV